MSFADQLTVTRVAAVPIVVLLFAVSFSGHNYWATGVFCAAMATDWFDGRVARRSGRTSHSARSSIRWRTSSSSCRR